MEESTGADCEVAPNDTGDESYSHDQCAICLLDYEEGDEISWSHNKHCHHEFHRMCLEKWLQKHGDCPYCRRPYLHDENDDEADTDAGTDIEANAPPGATQPETATPRRDVAFPFPIRVALG